MKKKLVSVLLAGVMTVGIGRMRQLQRRKYRKIQRL